MDKIFKNWHMPDMARELGVPYQTVVSWKHRGIPYKRIGDIVKKAQARGIDVTFEEVVIDRVPGATQ